MAANKSKEIQANGKAIQPKNGDTTGTQARRLIVLANAGIHTAEQVDAAISAVFSDLADGRSTFEESKGVLNAIGKKLHLENLRLRAGIYKTGKPRFFLNA